MFIELLCQGNLVASVLLTKDETDALNRLYGFETEANALLQAGANRNMVRHAEHDGMRLIAWLARHVEKNGDPLKTLVRMAIDAGFDVDPADVEWAEKEEE